VRATDHRCELRTTSMDYTAEERRDKETMSTERLQLRKAVRFILFLRRSDDLCI